MKHKYLLLQLVKTDFKMRYNNSVLGVVWVVLKPLLLFLVLYGVFSFAFGMNDPYYKLNLFLGLILFSFFTEGTTKGMNSLLDKANIILKVDFPRHLAVIASIINSSISLFFNLIVFAFFYFYYPKLFTFIGFGKFVGVIILMFLIVFGISCFLSILYVRFRDLGAIWEVLTTVLFYATPIFYPLTLIPENFQKIYFLNPLADFVVIARNSLVVSAPLGSTQLQYVVVLSFGLAIFGYIFFIKQVRKIAEYF